MIAVDRELLAAVFGGTEPGAGGEELPGPNRRSTEGHMRIETPLYDTGWDSGTHTTAKTNYAACLELMPDNTPPEQIRAACGTPNRPKF
jgi:hypothetical protein